MQTIADRLFIQYNFAAVKRLLTTEIFTRIYSSLIRDENNGTISPIRFLIYCQVSSWHCVSSE